MSTITLCSELRVTRADLKALPTPARLGPRHFPVKHIDLVTNLDEVLKANDLEIVEEKLGLNGEDGERLFAATIVRPQPNSPLSSYARDGQDFALGYRSGNDQSLCLVFIAGVGVFVCSNLELHGDSVLLKRRHTTGLGDGGLGEELNRGIGKYVEQQKGYVILQDQAKKKELGEEKAKSLIYDGFRAGILPGSAFTKVDRNFFRPEPEWTDCQGRTLHALQSAFTRELRGRKPARLFKGTQILGRLVAAELN